MKTINQSKQAISLRTYCSIYKPSLTHIISLSKPLFEDIHQLHKTNCIHAHISYKSSFLLMKNETPIKILLQEQKLLICDKMLGNMALRSADDLFPEDCAPELKYAPHAYPLISKKVDIYSSASLLYFMLYGHIYQYDNPGKYYERERLMISPKLEEICSKKTEVMFIDFLHSCLSFDYTYRPDAKEALKILDKMIL